jgi:hypothetical protein
MSPINKETAGQPAMACENPSALFYLLVKMSVSAIYRGSPETSFFLTKMPYNLLIVYLSRFKSTFDKT